MASIIKRKSKYSVVYYYIDQKGNKQQKWETCNTYKDAKNRKAEIEYQQSNGTFIAPSDVKLKDFLEDFVKIYGSKKWALSTYQSNCGLINNYINPLIGDMCLQDFTVKFIDDFYLKLKKVKAVTTARKKPTSEYLSQSTIAGIHKVLRCAFGQAEKWEMIARNPFALVEKPRTKYKKRDIWEAETIMKALEACDDMALYVAINLAFACSMRYGEIAGLTWDNVHITDDDIDDENSYLYIDKELSRCSREVRELLDDKDIIFVFPSVMANSHTNLILKTPKTDSSVRKVWIPRTLAYILREWKDVQLQYKDILRDDYYDYNLVLTLTNGRPMENRVMQKEFDKLKKKANLPNVDFHSLRHSSTTYKLKLNHGDLKATQGDTGHSQIDMITDIYAHILDEDRKINAQKFEKSFYVKTHSNPLRDVVPPKEELNPDLVNLVNTLHNSPELVTMLTQMMKQNAIRTN